MSSWSTANVKVPQGRKISFGADTNLAIYSDSSDVLKVIATTDAGSLSLSSGLGGISLDATVGTTGTGSQNGPISLISKGASSWTNNSSTLEIKSTGVNGKLNLSTEIDDLTLSAGGDMAIDSIGLLNIGTNGASGIMLGSATNHTTVAGNLLVNGTVKTVSRTNVDIGENLLTLNSASGGSATGIDSGLLIQPAPADITATGVPLGGPFVSTASGAAANQLGLQLEDSVTVVNTIVGISSGLFNGQALRVKSVASDVATFDDNWTPMSLSGTINNVAFSFTTSLVTILGSDFVSGELKEGCVISVVFDNGQPPVIFTVSGVLTQESSMSLTFPVTTTQATNVSSETAVLSVLNPGFGASYSSYANYFNGMFWHAADQKFYFASTMSDPGYGSVTPAGLLDIAAKNAQFTLLSFTGTSKAEYIDNAITGASISMTGGFGTVSNILAHTNGSSDGINAPVVDLTQSATDPADSVVALTQNYTEGAFMTFNGSSNTVSNLGTVEYNIVSTQGGVNTNITNANAQAFIKVRINDSGTGAGSLTDGLYYIPIYSLV